MEFLTACDWANSGLTTVQDMTHPQGKVGWVHAFTVCVHEEQTQTKGCTCKFWFLAHGYLPGIRNGKTFGIDLVSLDYIAGLD
jgi:hypothetical protein